MIAQSRPLRAKAGKHKEAKSGRLPNRRLISATFSARLNRHADLDWRTRSAVLFFSPFACDKCNDHHLTRIVPIMALLQNLCPLPSDYISRLGNSFRLQMAQTMQHAVKCNNFRKRQISRYRAFLTSEIGISLSR